MSELPLRRDVVPGSGPFVHPENAGFWESLTEGQLRLQQCSECGTVRFPIAPTCWKCLAPAHEWREIDGNGTVAAAIRIERATGNAVWQEATPYFTGLVDTVAGIRLPGRILCRCGEGARMGSPVRVVRIPTKSEYSTYAFEHECEENC